MTFRLKRCTKTEPSSFLTVFVIGLCLGYIPPEVGVGERWVDGLASIAGVVNWCVASTM